MSFERREKLDIALIFYQSTEGSGITVKPVLNSHTREVKKVAA